MLSRPPRRDWIEAISLSESLFWRSPRAYLCISWQTKWHEPSIHVIWRPLQFSAHFADFWRLYAVKEAELSCFLDGIRFSVSNYLYSNRNIFKFDLYTPAGTSSRGTRRRGETMAAGFKQSEAVAVGHRVNRLEWSIALSIPLGNPSLPIHFLFHNFEFQYSIWRSQFRSLQW